MVSDGLMTAIRDMAKLTRDREDAVRSPGMAGNDGTAKPHWAVSTDRKRLAKKDGLGVNLRIHEGDLVCGISIKYGLSRTPVRRVR